MYVDASFLIEKYQNMWCSLIKILPKSLEYVQSQTEYRISIYDTHIQNLWDNTIFPL